MTHNWELSVNKCPVGLGMFINTSCSQMGTLLWRPPMSGHCHLQIVPIGHRADILPNWLWKCLKLEAPCGVVLSPSLLFSLLPGYSPAAPGK